MKELPSNSHLLSLDQLAGQLENRFSQNTKPVWVLSDFDGTLCDEYVFNAATNSHLPIINSELALQARNINLVIATARHSTDPTVTLVHHTLVDNPEVPIICENGGVVFFPESGQKQLLISPQDQAHLELILPQLSLLCETAIPKGEKLFINKAATLITLRLQNETGRGTPENHSSLAAHLSTHLELTPFVITSTGNTVTLQTQGVDKSQAFSRWLHIAGIDRNSIFVIGLGDAANDSPLFNLADLSIGVDDCTFGLADWVCPRGPQASHLIIDTLRRHHE